MKGAQRVPSATILALTVGYCFRVWTSIQPQKQEADSAALYIRRFHAQVTANGKSNLPTNTRRRAVRERITN